MKNGLIEKNRSLGTHRIKATRPKTANGKTKDLYPVVLDGGRTIIYISDRKKESEIRQRYEEHQHQLPAEKSRS